MERLHRVGIPVTAVVMFLSLLILVLAFIYTLRQQNEVDRKFCQITVQNRESQRASWQALRLLALDNLRKTPGLTDEQRAKRMQEINTALDHILRPIPALECKDNKPVQKEE